MSSPQEITLKLTVDQYNTVINALTASVQWQQQSTSVLMATLQSQVVAQVTPVNAPSALAPQGA